jgi:predicted ribosomally synthesized peptide with nif11-like leader
MTKEAANAFAERLRADEALQAKLAGAADRAARLALAREEGFDLGAEDIGAVKQALSIEELSDDDLEKVAGGLGVTTTATIASGATVSVGAAAALL